MTTTLGGQMILAYVHFLCQTNSTVHDHLTNLSVTYLTISSTTTTKAAAATATIISRIMGLLVNKSETIRKNVAHLMQGTVSGVCKERLAEIRK
jgi:hypothetical protein